MKKTARTYPCCRRHRQKRTDGPAQTDKGQNGSIDEREKRERERREEKEKMRKGEIEEDHDEEKERGD